MILFYTARLTAVLFEAGLILNLNLKEERLLANTQHRNVLIDYVLAAIDRFCARVFHA